MDLKGFIKILVLAILVLSFYTPVLAVGVGVVAEIVRPVSLISIIGVLLGSVLYTAFAAIIMVLLGTLINFTGKPPPGKGNFSGSLNLNNNTSAVPEKMNIMSEDVYTVNRRVQTPVIVSPAGNY